MDGVRIGYHERIKLVRHIYWETFDIRISGGIYRSSIYFLSLIHNKQRF
jgi:hypothetical protein